MNHRAAVGFSPVGAAWSKLLHVQFRRFVVVSSALVFGCGNATEERPPLARDTCGGDPCVTTPLVGVGVGAATGDAGAPSPGGSSSGGLLAGDVIVVISADLTQTLPFGLAELAVRVEADDGRVSESTYGGGDFEIELTGRAPHWLSLRQTAGTQNLITTLQPVERGTDQTVSMVERQVIEDIADNLATGPLVLSADRAHALLQFTRNGVPLSGVSVVTTDGTVAYDLGSIYSDALDATAERGTAALMNLSAVPFPGGSSEVEIATADTRFVFELQLAQDAVTLVVMEL